MSNITVQSIPQPFYGGIITPEFLKPGEIQLWQAPNEVGREEYQKLRQLLSPDEIERAARFRFERDRMQYVVGRTLLRLLLASYLQTDAGRISFHYTSKGKPELLCADKEWGVEFNLAHSGGVILMGFARDRKIGVDIEQIRQDLEVDDIAERFFSLSERLYLASLPLAQRFDPFFRFWTRKEALLKGTGEGLSVTLDSFSVFSNRGEDFCRLQTDGTRNWLIQDVSAAAGYAAAVAIECNAEEAEVPPEPISG